MAALSVYAQAHALAAACAHEGVLLALDGDKLRATGPAPSEALALRLGAFCGVHEGREHVETYRALRAVVAAPSQAAKDLLALRVACAIGLPCPFTLSFRRGKHACVASTSRHAYARAVAQGLPTFVLSELELAARAVARGRASPSDLDRWIACKARGEWRLTPELAGVLDPPGGDLEMPDVCFGELFDALDAELVDVQFEPVGDTSKGAA